MPPSQQLSPPMEDLASILHFDPRQGHIWLGGHRMTLMDACAFGRLRREIVDLVGVAQARAVFTRHGHHCGALAAEIAAKVRPTASLQDMFAVGPQLHALEGVVLPRPLIVELDVQRNHFYSEYEWHHSSECSAHVDAFGTGATPAGWAQVGFASGYASVFLGRPILFREVECIATGHSCCRIIGRPAEDWPEDSPDTGAIGQTAELAQMLARHGRSPLSPATDNRHRIIGSAGGFSVALDMLRQVAGTDALVLLLGESGVGKEMFARNLHAQSPRAGRPFVAVNCAAIPENLMESELFGVEKGAYTGATATRPGRFERAAGGTLFLDEIGTLSPLAQSKLLRVIQEREYERVGGVRILPSDVRIVAATNTDLRGAVEAGEFREDLFYRLNVFPIRIPPLRERRTDILPLMEHFLGMYRERHRRNVPGFEDKAVSAMLAYDWPGNVRELENVIERAVILAREGEPLRLHHLFNGGEKPGTGWKLGGDGRIAASQAKAQPPQELLMQQCIEAGLTLDEVEREMLKKALAATDGNRTRAAAALGISRAQFNYRYRRATGH